MKKKLVLKRDTLRNLAVRDLTNVAGGISVDPCSASCAGGCNTHIVACVDTNAATNCGCTTIGSFQCPTLFCAQGGNQ